MNLILPAVLSLLLVACSTVVPEPTPGTAEHQRWLHEQAREHFLTLKAEQRQRRGGAPVQRVTTREGAARPQAAPRTRQPQTRPSPTPRPSRRVVGDTIYEPTAEGRAEQRAWELRKAREYQQYEAREAKRLGKTPAQLTRAERAWIRARAE